MALLEENIQKVREKIAAAMRAQLAEDTGREDE